MASRSFLPSVFTFTAALFFTSISFAQSPAAAPAEEGAAPRAAPVIVVDVRGEYLDAASVRAGIGRELRASAVAPDDARAANAVGRVDVNVDAGATARPAPRGEPESGERKLTVSYRTLGAPVTRTVQLPADVQRAQRTAIFLAGNVARDEAGELLGANGDEDDDDDAEVGAETDADARAEPASKRVVRHTSGSSIADLARVHTILQAAAESGRSRRYAVGGTALGVGVALGVTSAILIATQKHPEDFTGGGSLVATTAPRDTVPSPVSLITAGSISIPTTGPRDTGIGLAPVAGVSLLAGLYMLTLDSSTEEQLYAEVAAHERRGDAADTLEFATERWRVAAERQRRARLVMGWSSATLAVASVTLATFFAFPKDDVLGYADRQTASAAALYSVAALTGITAVDALFREREVETSYRMWQTMHAPPTPMSGIVRPHFGVGKLDGGAMFSGGFSF